MAELSEIRTLIQRVVETDISRVEEDTREIAVNPMIGKLGWDTSDPNEVYRKYPVGDGRVDYCLRDKERSLVLIVVKRAGTDLSGHEEELRSYSLDGGASLAALTDGLNWWLYLPTADTSWEHCRFRQIDLRETNSDAAAAISGFLSRDRVLEGAALEEAQREIERQERDRKLRAVLEEAWIKLLRDPQSLLPEILSEKVEEQSGHRPDAEAVSNFLIEQSRYRGPADASPVHRNGSEEPERNPVHEVQEASTRSRKPPVHPEFYCLQGSRHEVSTWKELLTQLCQQLNEQVGPVFRQRVGGIKGRICPYFRTSTSELRNASHIPGTDLYIEVNQSSKSAEGIAHRIVKAVLGTDADFQIQTSRR